MIEPDFSSADAAATSDGRVLSWGLSEVAFELRTANLLSFLHLAPDHTPDGRLVRDKLSHMVADRLGLLDEGWAKP